MTKTDKTPDTNRAQPRDVDAEISLLGSLVAPNADMNTISEIVEYGIIPELFYNTNHQKIYSAILNLYEKGIMPEFTNLFIELKSEPNISYEYLDTIIYGTIGGNAKYYAKIIKEMALRRKIAREAQILFWSSYDIDTEPEYLLKQFSDNLDTYKALSKENNNSDKPISAYELSLLNLPEPEWLVKNIVPSGLALLVGAPKIGKSWLSLALAIAVANGGKFLGNFDIENQGDVLYLALEDTRRRVDKRVKTLCLDGVIPKNLFIETEYPKLKAGGLSKLSAWLSENPKARLIVIDVFQKVRDINTSKNSNAYADDYEDLGLIKSIADKYGITILVVHHKRKADAEDVLDTINGSVGFSGSPDGILIIKGNRQNHDAVLYRTGKDFDEDYELSIKLDVNMGGWQLLGRADEYRMTRQREDILNFLEKSNEPMTPKQISEAIELDANYVRKTLRRLLEDGMVRTFGYGKYIREYKNGK